MFYALFVYPKLQLLRVLTVFNNFTVQSFNWASLVAQMVKNLPAIQETWIWSLGQEDPLEEGMATHSSILAWRIPWTEESGGLSPCGHKELDMTDVL